MGMFSWITSDTEKELICHDIRNRDGNRETKTAYLLIPKEFGGGAYKVGRGLGYEGYGVFYEKDGTEHDAYAELAKWNGVAVEDFQKSRSNAISLYYMAKDPNVSQYKLGNYNTYETMKFPLKIVEKLCAYEDAEPCFDDPNQGWGGW